MKYTNQDLMKEFYEKEIRGTALDFGFQRCREILYAPWQYLKYEMENGKLRTIRFKYFGTFVVYPKRVLGILDKLRKRYKEQKDPPEKFLKKERMIKDFLERCE